ncbi:hypothetical protein KKF70_04475 [bacterium]|nr:hypothetical protein [bacterium]
MTEFGENCCGCAALITPIGILAKKLAHELTGLSHFSTPGWWKGWKGSLAGKELCVIDCGTGERAADCILFLKESGVKKIFFFGFAGSVNKSLSPGTFCSASAWAGGASFEEFSLSLREGKLPRKSARPFSSGQTKTDKGKIIYTLPSLFLESTIFEKLAEEGFDMVDMETAHAAFAAQGTDTSFFYYISDFQMEFIKTDMKKLTDACLKSVLL